MEYGFEPIENEDTVLSVPESNERIWLSHPMFKTGDLLKHIISKAIGINIRDWENDEHYEEKKNGLERV